MEKYYLKKEKTTTKNLQIRLFSAAVLITMLITVLTPSHAEGNLAIWVKLYIYRYIYSFTR